MATWKNAIFAIVCLLGLFQVKEILILGKTDWASLYSKSVLISSGSQETQGEVRIPLYEGYVGAEIENYLIDNLDALGFDSLDDPSGCKIWTSRNETPHYDDLHTYAAELEKYSRILKEHPGVPKDLRVMFKENPGQKDKICDSLELHQDGMLGLFPSRQLSYTRAGWVEPLTPPMRHHSLCYSGDLYSTDYMVHDFAHMCRTLMPHARTVFVDMGAALDFHSMESPAMYINKVYAKFGFLFDHVYAFEIDPKNATEVFNKVPPNMRASYHWMNIGVSADPNSLDNPLYTILSKFDKDDFIVVKLDIDTPSTEVPLAYQILNNTELNEKIDHFYFEHHVHLEELAGSWGDTMKGTIKESMLLFRDIRGKGIASHFWP